MLNKAVICVEFSAKKATLSFLLIVNDKVMNVYDVLMAAISKNSKQTDTFIQYHPL